MPNDRYVIQHVDLYLNVNIRNAYDRHMISYRLTSSAMQHYHPSEVHSVVSDWRVY